MFKKWLDSQEHASWEQMLTALRSRSVQKNALANKIENMLIREGECYCVKQLATLVEFT